MGRPRNKIEFLPPIDEKRVIKSASFIIDFIGRHFENVVISKEFINELDKLIKDLYYKAENFDFETLEKEFAGCIFDADNIKDIKLTYNYDDDLTKRFNKIFKNKDIIDSKQIILKEKEKTND